MLGTYRMPGLCYVQFLFLQISSSTREVSYFMEKEVETHRGEVIAQVTSKYMLSHCVYPSL